MKYTYEIAVLYHPGLEVDLTKAEDRVQKIIKDSGGEVTATDNWGKRKLAYPIKKQEHGIYVFYTVQLPPENVNRLENTLNITDEVIRFLITRLDSGLLKLKAAKAEKAARKEKKAQSTDEGADKSPVAGIDT